MLPFDAGCKMGKKAMQAVGIMPLFFLKMKPVAGNLCLQSLAFHVWVIKGGKGKAVVLPLFFCTGLIRHCSSCWLRFRSW